MTTPEDPLRAISTTHQCGDCGALWKPGDPDHLCPATPEDPLRNRNDRHHRPTSAEDVPPVREGVTTPCTCGGTLRAAKRTGWRYPVTVADLIWKHVR